MRLVIRTLIITLAIATAAGTAPKSPDAPADESFGPFKYSPISVRTKIDALARSYRQRWQDDASILHDAEMIETSFRAWAQKYPNDRWLAPTAYHLAQLYQVVQSAEARSHARALFQLVATAYPRTREGHNARLRLRQGFPALQPESPVSPTPNPYAPTPQPTPAPTPEPTATPTPAPTPSATPSPTPAPKKHRLFG
jgi:hypothetical protein